MTFPSQKISTQTIFTSIFPNILIQTTHLVHPHSDIPHPGNPHPDIIQLHTTKLDWSFL